MLYDLNIPWTPSTSPSDLDRTISFASSLGYTVLALNHTITPPLPSQISSPLPKLPPPPTQPSSKPRPTILHRATLLLDDPSQNFRLPALLPAYDILAVRPTSERAFQAACLSIADASIISLDLTQLFAFHFRPKTVMAAVARGVRFEICYAQVLAAPEPRARALFVSNLANLARGTKGRGLVISSEARGALHLRGAPDVVNLMAVWGVPTERAAEALRVNPRAVVANEAIKRSGFRGVVNIIEVGGRAGDVKKSAEGDEKNAAADGGKKKKMQKGNAAQKRKTPDENSDAAQGKLSNRQAKKLRLAQADKDKADAGKKQTEAAA
ncbi:putative ribonuclease P protein subunit 3 [Colletotrichum trifolii]|uniref:Putative ribonuclease P protein subunit 3 n=1 Tax=Colletotrichum trifolii TaxID=5466 RepID=A0A4R8RQQ6_COLTR|nr:putative ribonuclease P protein subunit 3 [Colletotrichum trifolii]